MKFPEEYRYRNPGGIYDSEPGSPYGAFRLPGSVTGGRAVRVMACDGTLSGWEHVSVTLIDQPKKAPSWPEMCAVKACFWDDTDCVVQFHPPKTDYVNLHTGCLHLWRCVQADFPMPPIECV